MKNKQIALIAIVLLSIKSILNMSALIVLTDDMDLIVNLLIITMLLPKIIQTKYSYKEMLIILFIGILLLITSIITNELIIMSSYLVIVAVKDMNMIKIIKFINISKISIVMVHMVLFFLEYAIGDKNLIGHYTFNNQARYSFFFQNQNTFSATIFWIQAEIIFINMYEKKVNNKLLYAILGIISVFIYSMTISRTYIVNCVILSILLIISVLKKGKNFLYISARCILPVMLVLSYIICCNYTSKSSVYLNLDYLLSRRISLGKIALNKYGVSFLPKAVNYFGIIELKNIYAMRMTVDNIYIRYIISYGLLVFACIERAFYRFIKSIKNGELKSVIFAVFVIMYAIYGFTEVVTVNVCLCFPLLFLSRAEKERNFENVSISNNAGL